MSRNKVEKNYNPAQYDVAFQSIELARRHCVTFVPESPNGKVCHCNRTREEHPAKAERARSTEKWQLNRHTVKDSGKEQGVSLVNGAPYVRCDIETDPKVLETILFEIWKIDPPALLMQVTGGHKYFKLRGKMEVSLLDDLVEFVSKSNTWLLTNGMNVGVVQLIGQAIRKRKLTRPKETTIAIGISNYGCVKNLSDFQRSSPSSHPSESSIQAGEQNLEMNHTHFILFDDGTVRRYDIGDSRTRLIQSIAQRRRGENNLSIPVVTLLFEGGEDSLRSIYHDLRQNIPIIIINNTGRMADYLSRWLTRTQEMNIDSQWTTIIELDEDYPVKKSAEEHRSGRHLLRTKFDRHLYAMTEELSEAINGNDSAGKKGVRLKQVNAEILPMILFCLQPTVRSRITVFNVNRSAQLPEIILRSILKSSSGRTSMDSLLELALDWNCISTAKEYIIQDSLDNIHDPKSIFSRALTKQRHQFVHYFIQLGFQFDELFFDPKENPFAARNAQHPRNKRYDKFISLLYTEDSINREDWLLRDVVKSIQSTSDLNDLFRDLVGGYMKPLYYDSQIEEQEDRMGVKRFTTIISPAQDLEQGQLIASDAVYKQLAKDVLIRDLFLWAIVMNHMEMAKVFISHMKDRICAALIATEILSHLRDTSSDAVHGDKKTELTRWITYFEQYSISCLDLCFKNDPDMARLLTIQRVELFGDVTCLQVADDADSKRFASHPCCRQAENSIWYDKLHSDQYQIRHYAGLLAGIYTFGLLAPFTTRFRTISQNPLPTRPTLQSYGINYSDTYANSAYQGRVGKRFFQIWQFHQSLHVKYTYHHIQYVAFLFLFSYFLLFHFDPLRSEQSTVHLSEWLVIILLSCMAIEEIRIFFSQDSLSLLGKCHSYFRTFFKQLTFVSFVLFYVGLILRFQSLGPSASFQAARIVMGYDLWIWWIRSLAFIIVNPFLGPHLVSMGKMLKNLSFFAILIAIVMTAYGVSSRSMAFYGTFEFSIRNVLRSVLYPVYYLLYTNLSGELSGLDDTSETSHSIATHVLLAFHMLLINILMVNLLIAMFNKSFQDVVVVQEDIWNYQQYSVVREYFDRPPLFIPFSTIFDLIALVQMISQWYLRVRYNYANPTQRVFKVIAVQPELELAWQEFESASTYVFAQREALNKNARLTSGENEIKPTENDPASLVTVRKDDDPLNQLRQEFKAAIKDLRNDIRLLVKQK